MNYRTSQNGYTNYAETNTSAASFCAIMLIMDAIIMASILLSALRLVLVLVLVVVLVLLHLVNIVIITSKSNTVKTDSKIYGVA